MVSEWLSKRRTNKANNLNWSTQFIREIISQVMTDELGWGWGVAFQTRSAVSLKGERPAFQGRAVQLLGDLLGSQSRGLKELILDIAHKNKSSHSAKHPPMHSSLRQA